MNDAHSHLLNCILIRVNIIFQLKQSCFSLSSCLIHFNTPTSKSSRFSISEKKNLINVSTRCFIDRFFFFSPFSLLAILVQRTAVLQKIFVIRFSFSRVFFSSSLRLQWKSNKINGRRKRTDQVLLLSYFNSLSPPRSHPPPVVH